MSTGGLFFFVYEPGRQPRQITIVADLGLGRSPECACVLVDSAASAWHAIVKDVEGHLAIVDLGSTNRTKVHGGPTLGRGDYAFLFPGMELSLGRTRLVVHSVVHSPSGDHVPVSSRGTLTLPPEYAASLPGQRQPPAPELRAGEPRSPERPPPQQGSDGPPLHEEPNSDPLT